MSTPTTPTSPTTATTAAMRLTTPGRWSDPGWRRAALAWADAELGRSGVRRTGWSQPHVRPWSTVLRLETDLAGPVWLKANGDGTRHESLVLGALAALGIPNTPFPLHTQDHEGWTLLPDGGPTSREAYGGRTPTGAMARILAAYAETQRATEPHVDRFVALGVDDLRPDVMPAHLAALVDELAAATGPAALTTDDATRLRALLPAYAEACAELAAAGIAPALQHDDLHDNNVFHRGPVFFDWGDAVVGHPFGTMLATLRSVAHHHGLDAGDPVLARLADAYTEAWTDVADRATLRRQVELAIRVGPLTRALAWRRALTGCDDAAWAEDGDSVPGWLLELHEPALPLLPATLG